MSLSASYLSLSASAIYVSLSASYVSPSASAVRAVCNESVINHEINYVTNIKPWCMLLANVT